MESEKRFNLLREQWVPVLKKDYTVDHETLIGAIVNSHNYVGLSGELPTQDVAMLRLLLAVLHTVFSRVDENGEVSPLNDDNAMERWEALWNLGEFPKEPIVSYLEKWEDRFWLFHPGRPFYQVPEAIIGTEYTAAKLNGELSESGNKVKLFQKRNGDAKRFLTYPEAARWLVYVNGYDDNSSKPKGKAADGGKLPAVGAGWLGRIGLIMAEGDTLFHTLMLNLTLLMDGEKEWHKNVPIWELESPRNKERTEIFLPDNPAELLTLQSRRLLLTEQDNVVVGYRVLGGDFFKKEDSFSEQMTVWKPVEKNKSIVGYMPKRHDSSKQMWREFSSFVNVNKTQHLPGVMSWVTALKEEGYLDEEKMIRFRISSVQYGDSDYMATDVYSDSLSFHTALLGELGKSWRVAVNEQISRCDRIAERIGWLASDLVKAEGGDSDRQKDVAAKCREQFYYRIDAPFRAWLGSLDPENGDIKAKAEEWQERSLQIAREMGREMIDSAGQAAYIGRLVKKDAKDKGQYYSAPKSYNSFLYNLNQIDE